MGFALGNGRLEDLQGAEAASSAPFFHVYGMRAMGLNNCACSSPHLTGFHTGTKAGQGIAQGFIRNICQLGALAGNVRFGEGRAGWSFCSAALKRSLAQCQPPDTAPA